jgi:diguanylate cyclase (GGDEF)-like protein
MTVESLLAEAHRSLDAGDGITARELASRALAEARAADRPAAQASSLLCLAHGDRLLSRHRDAHRSSQRAAQLFCQLGDVAGEVMALTTLSHTAANLGRSEEAVEVALLGVRLAQSLPPGSQQVLSHNYLGIAYFFAKDHEKASAAFERALALAASCSPPINPFQVHCNQIWSEATRLFFERYHSGRLPGIARLAQRHAECAELTQRMGVEALSRGVRVSAHANWHFASGLLACWQNDLQRAETEADAGCAWAQEYGAVTWLDVQEAWVRAECAWARRDWDGALGWADRMIDRSMQAEHEEFACLGHLLAAQIHAARGNHRLAYAELKRLRRRELSIRTESLASRERVVQWQLDMRRTEIDLRAMESASKQFERLSMQDSLTGIANRRCFEERLDLLLANRGGSPLCVALIDVDHFKTVNDGFSHQTGDDVLRNISDILAAEVRAKDLAARLAGDEFVLILAGVDAQHGHEICERIRLAVERFPWVTIAPQLRVTVSVGSAAAIDGDSVESLLHRADAAMYGAKASCRDRAEAALDATH